MNDLIDIEDRELFFDQLVRSQVNGVYVYDLVLGRNVYISPRYTAFTGYTKPELDALDEDAFAELFHFEDRARVFEHLTEVAQATDQTPIPLEYRFRRKDGRWVWLYGHDVPVARNQDGAVTRFMGSFVDVTRQYELLEGLKQFGYSVAHDLREPASRVHLSAELLGTALPDDASPQIRALLQTVMGESKRLLEVIGGFGRLAELNNRGPRGTVDLGALVQECATRLHLEVEQPVKLSPVHGYADLLRILFENLLRNVLDHAKAGAAIKLTCVEAPQKPSVFGLHNTGSEIPAEVAARVFESFQTFQSSGTGLGLAICAQVVGAHEGKVWIESGSDWTHIRFTLEST